MYRIKDLTNQRFGRLVAIYPIVRRANDGKAIWLCRCDCGNLTEVTSNDLPRGNTKSCGCLIREMLPILHLKHGDAVHGNILPPYGTWYNIHQRCLNPNATGYKYYGGRGIIVCDDWKNYQCFKDWALANGYKDGLTIDRIDNDGGYMPDNCQWITLSENSRKAHRERREN